MEDPLVQWLSGGCKSRGWVTRQASTCTQSAYTRSQAHGHTLTEGVRDLVGLTISCTRSGYSFGKQRGGSGGKCHYRAWLKEDKTKEEEAGVNDRIERSQNWRKQLWKQYRRSDPVTLPGWGSALKVMALWSFWFSLVNTYDQSELVLRVGDAVAGWRDARWGVGSFGIVDRSGECDKAWAVGESRANSVHSHLGERNLLYFRTKVRLVSG